MREAESDESAGSAAYWTLLTLGLAGPDFSGEQNAVSQTEDERRGMCRGEYHLFNLHSSL